MYEDDQPGLLKSLSEDKKNKENKENKNTKPLSYLHKDSSELFKIISGKDKIIQEVKEVIGGDVAGAMCMDQKHEKFNPIRVYWNTVDKNGEYLRQCDKCKINPNKKCMNKGCTKERKRNECLLLVLKDLENGFTFVAILPYVWQFYIHKITSDTYIFTRHDMVE